eukprot:PITA_05609
MSEYDFEISYINGKENVVADALSRRPRTFSLVTLKVNSRERVLEKLFEDSWYLKVISTIQTRKQIEPKFEGYVLEPDELLRFQGRMYIPKERGMKHDIVQFVAKCLECQQVKADHRHLVGLLQTHDIPISKLEVISMDFVVGLPLTSQRHNAILVIIDKLTKSAHFIPVRDTYDVTDVA